MNRTFKYSVIALRDTEDETTCEYVFEDSSVFHQHDYLSVTMGQQKFPCVITSVHKIDHITTPNDSFDYRIFAVAV